MEPDWDITDTPMGLEDDNPIEDKNEDDIPDPDDDDEEFDEEDDDD